MTKEDKQLLLADLSARLPYYPKCKMIDKLRVIDNKPSPSYTECLFPRHLEIFYFHNNFTIKPYLRPMSSMTEEEAKEIAILHDIKDILSVKVTSDYIDVIVDDGVCSTERRTIWYDEIVSSIKCFDWFNANHFDYRDLIPKGLALKAPKGMYN